MNYTRQLMAQDVAEILEKEGLKDIFLATEDLKLKEAYAVKMILHLRYFMMGRYDLTGKESLEAIQPISEEVGKDVGGFLSEVSSAILTNQVKSVQ